MSIITLHLMVRRIPFYARTIVYSLELVVYIISMLAINANICYILRTGRCINYISALQAFRKLDLSDDFARSNSQFFLFLTGAELSVFFIIYIATSFFSASHKKVTKEKCLKEKRDVVVQGRYKFSYWLLVQYSAVLILLAAVTFSGKVKHPNLSSNTVFDLVRDVRLLIRKRYSNKDKDTANNSEDKMAFCSSGNDAIRQLLSEEQVCFKEEETIDYSFLKRAPGSTIKNVVYLVIESARNDAFPFNHDSDLAKALRKNFPDITPAMQKIASRSLFSRNSKSTSSYTIKSLLSLLCSMYPYPENFTVEHEYEYYNKCLPQLLKENGFATSYFQSSDSSFDQQIKTLGKMGFNTIFDKDKLERYLNHTKSTAKPINYFGYEDDLLFDPMFYWIDQQIAEQKPFFTTFLANVSHDPFRTPLSHKRKIYTNPTTKSEVNSYLNSLNYMDSFIDKFMKKMKKRGLLEETMFVILGDHGVALWENGSFGTCENSLDHAFSIPLMFYSENASWQKYFSKPLLNHTFTNLDVMPTVLDILDLENLDSNTRDYRLEGKSIIRNYEPQPVYISLTNPGLTSLIIREGHLKYVKYYDYDPDEYVFNLRDDPNEQNPLILDELSLDWITKMRSIEVVFKKKLVDLYNKTTSS